MLPSDRTFALRMIPYGIHVLTALDAEGGIVAATTPWVTQTSLAPPLLAVALPAGGAACRAVRDTGRFALHMLGREDAGEAFAFWGRPPVMEDGTLSGWSVQRARSGLPLLDNAVAVVECAVLATLEFGDHHPVIAEVVEAHVRLPEQDRPDEMILRMADLGQTMFYGG